MKLLEKCRTGKEVRDAIMLQEPYLFKDRQTVSTDTSICSFFFACNR